MTGANRDATAAASRRPGAARERGSGAARERGSGDPGSLDPAVVVARLRRAGCVFAEDEAALLLEAARSGGELESLLARRVAGEPLEHVLGWVEFCGLRVPIAPGVFIPRQRTAFLVETAAALTAPGATVVDLCCGCGAIALALRERVPGLDLYACDLDPVAVRCASESLGAHAAVFAGDLFDALPGRIRGRIDTIAANVPYVPTSALPLMPVESREHEDRIALYGGEDGLDLLRRVAAGARTWLRPGGVVVSEVGRDQASAAVAALAVAGLAGRWVRSREHETTLVVGTRPPLGA